MNFLARRGGRPPPHRAPGGVPSFTRWAHAPDHASADGPGALDEPLSGCDPVLGNAVIALALFFVDSIFVFHELPPQLKDTVHPSVREGVEGTIYCRTLRRWLKGGRRLDQDAATAGKNLKAEDNMATVADPIIPQDLLDILVCPLGKAPLRLEGETLVCTKCGLAYPIEDGIPSMLVDEAKLPTGVTDLKQLACYTSRAHT